MILDARCTVCIGHRNRGTVRIYAVIQRLTLFHAHPLPADCFAFEIGG